MKLTWALWTLPNSGVVGTGGGFIEFFMCGSQCGLGLGLGHACKERGRDVTVDHPVTTPPIRHAPSHPGY